MFVTGSNTIKFHSNGVQTDPTTATVMATTGAQPHGRYLVTVTATSTVNAQFLIQRRNAADDTTVESSAFFVLANDTVTLDYMFVLEVNQRVRVMMNAGVIGFVAASLNWQRVS